jgi:hypothetical protein
MKRIDDDILSAVTDDSINDSAALLFAPLDKRAFGVAVGFSSALLTAGVTILSIVEAPEWKGLDLLANYFTGYSVTWRGVAVGAEWSFAVGFVAGWLIAFARNLTLAVSLFLLRSKAELDESSDFLDHI